MRISESLPAHLREIDPKDQEQWEAVAKSIQSRVDGAAQNRIADQAARAVSPAAKVIYLRKMADNLVAAAAPSIACKSGCAGCCHMSVIIGEAEAEQIAKATGARIRKKNIRYTPVGDEKYSGDPCVFLENGKCSIYENRPFACRVYFVVHHDNSRCQIVPGVPAMAPSIDLDGYYTAYARAFGPQVVETMADVREYFPDGLSRRRK